MPYSALYHTVRIHGNAVSTLKMENFMKTLKQLASIFLLIVLLLQVFPIAATATTDGAEAYSVNASAAMLIELNTESILFEQDADKTIYPASLTKILTCLLAIENGDLDDVVTVSAAAFEGMHPDGSSAELKLGEQIVLEDLLYCLMLASANDGCNVVAEHISGSVESFVELMNERAKEIGCTGTHFANTHGLHDDNHYTTARDLAKISMVALQNETFLKICTTTKYTVPATNLSEERTLYTTNYLVSDAQTPEYFYGRAAGVKTGYTSKAGRCLITTATGNDLYLLSVVCGAQTSIKANGELRFENFTESQRLLEYGLENFDYATVLSSLDTIAQINVNYSAGSDSVVVSPNQSITTILPNNYNNELLETEITIDSPDGVDAPVNEGDKLGSVTVTYDGTEIGSADLVAITDVPRSDFSYYRTQIGEFIRMYWWVAILALLGLLLLLYGIVCVRAYVRKRKRRKAREQAREQRRRAQV